MPLKILIAVMTLWLSLTSCWASESVKLTRGDSAPFSGYLFTPKRTQEIAEGWREAQQKYEIVNKAYTDLKRESLDSVRELRAEATRLEDDLRKVRRRRRRSNFWTVFGSLAFGTGIGMIIHNNR